MSKISSILFDLDGTLVDSERGILASCQVALRSLGHELPAATKLTIGPPLEEIMSTLLAQFGDDRLDEAVAAYRHDYGINGILQSEPYPGIGDILCDLSGAGARLFVATSKRTVFAKRILEALNLAPRFIAIYGSEPGGAVDHKPELIAHLLKDQGLNAENCVMVGDKSHDIVGAHANGMRAIGVLWGYGCRSELETAAADDLVEQPAQLLNLLREMRDG